MSLRAYRQRQRGAARPGRDAPAEIPEREPRDRAPVHGEHREPAHCHAARAAVRLAVARPFERLHLAQLRLDRREAPPQEARAVREGRDLDADRPAERVVPRRGAGGGAVGLADAERELGRARGVADEVADVGAVRPLERAPAWRRAPEGDGGRRGRELREDEAGDVGERLGGVQEEDGGGRGLQLCAGWVVRAEVAQR